MMSNSTILHIMEDDKFIEPFIRFVEDHHKPQVHHFIISGKNPHSTLRARKNLTTIHGMQQTLRLLFSIASKGLIANKIILHGLHNKRLILLISLMPWLLKRSYWFIWGADLYAFQTKDHTWRNKVDDFLRRCTIPKIGHLVSYLPGDIALARQHYQAKGIYHECLLYPSNICNAYELPKKEDLNTHILIGNSATTSNNHLEIFEKIKTLRQNNLILHCPLSYGNQHYALHIAEQGRKHFGDNFNALLSFMDFNSYLKLLGSIDVAIFAHARQQAMGNIINLIGAGKTVFLRENTSSWAFLNQMGFYIKTFEAFNFEKITQAQAEHNQQLAVNIFSSKNLSLQLSQLFDR